MRRLALIFLLFLPAFAHAALLGTGRTWEFMQSVGGIALGKPALDGEIWMLPVLCDVSGLKTFSAKPKMLNSGLVWADTKATVSDHEIFITIETGLAKLSGKSAACGVANLGRLKPGKYRVMYRDPDGQKNFIGEVELGL